MFKENYFKNFYYIIMISYICVSLYFIIFIEKSYSFLIKNGNNNLFDKITYSNYSTSFKDFLYHKKIFHKNNNKFLSADIFNFLNNKSLNWSISYNEEFIFEISNNLIICFNKNWKIVWKLNLPSIIKSLPLINKNISIRISIKEYFDYSK